MKGLTISADLTLPLDWITYSTCIYGARGSGKTTLGRVMAEEAHAAGQRFCAVDLKGDWWGLKASEDGQTEGIPVVIFGGDHADLPLEAEAGTQIADIVAALQQPVVLDLENLSKTKQTYFLAAFFERLYDVNRDPILLLLDEAQRYAPQKPMSPMATVCLGAVEDLVKLGRKHGIGPVLFTQRGSGLNKEVSELCDMLVVFRTPGPLDQDRVKDWLDANATREQRDTVMGQIASMPTGTAIFASGHPSLKIFQTSAVRLPRTFDSSATPKIGAKPRTPKRLAPVEIHALRERMTAAIERADANDPKKLRAQITALQREMEALRRSPGKPVTVERVVEKIVERPVILAADIANLERLLAKAKPLAEELTRIGEHIAISRDVITDAMFRVAQAAGAADARLRAPVPDAPQRPRPATPPPVSTPHPVAPARPAAPPATANGADPTTGVSLGKAERLILTALAQFAEGKSAQQLGIITGYSADGGGFRNALGALRAKGLIEGGNSHMTITEEGRGLIGPVDPAPVGAALLDMWLGHRSLGKAERAVLRVLAQQYPAALSSGEVGAQTDPPYAPDGGGFRNALGRLRTLGLIEGGNSGMRASADLV